VLCRQGSELFPTDEIEHVAANQERASPASSKRPECCVTWQGGMLCL
jgi:hypothetical protein